ncbi:hypothetical protein Daus18300_013927 [Diaporthe australafricana]|uniref:Uncharacterized protein n=1 Tax=Diaporthe australafricana TaxID=127596 RepID=A0ABR3VX79_9PEZI
MPLQETTAGWQQQITALKRHVIELKDMIDDVLLAPSSSVSLPEPDKLEDIAYYDIWIPYLTAKLELDKAESTSAENEQSRDKIIFFYVYAQLGRKLRAQVLSTLKIANITNTYNHQQLLDHLKSLWAGLNKTQELGNSSVELEMGVNEPFVDYFTKVQEYISKGEAAGWDDQEKMAYLKRGLQSSTIGRLLKVQLEPPKTYSGLVSACLRLDSISRDKSIGKLGRQVPEDAGEEILSEEEDDPSVSDEGQDQEEHGDSEGE